MLKFKLPYECDPAAGVKRAVDLSGRLTISDGAFFEQAENILAVLAEKYPKFSFSHKIELYDNEESIVNCAGAELVFKDRYMLIVLLIKYKESKNLMDGSGVIVTRDLGFDDIIKELSWQCEAYEEKADFSEEPVKMPVVLMGGQEFGMKFMTDLRGDSFASGASLFSGKTGQKLFNDKFSLIVNRNPEMSYNCFFDGEGVVLPEDRFALIENGVLKSPYTSKRIAKKYGLPVTGSASMPYDSAPDASPGTLSAARGDKTIKQLLDGRKAVYAVMAGGGDFTPQGEYASPVQTAYLFDGEKCLGRLPQLSMSSHVNDMFGNDFIGVSKEGGYPGSPYAYLTAEMNVRKIDGWM
jgi:PmbA protein